MDTDSSSSNNNCTYYRTFEVIDMGYVIKEVPKDSQDGLVLRGAVRELWQCKNIEAMVAGPAETGKTIGCLAKCHALLLKYPGAQGAIVRKTYQSMSGSVLASYEKKILGSLFKNVVKPYGGEKPEWYDYPNGSRLWVGGLDNPDKVLSSERDFVYVNQAEEIELSHWQYLLTRTTGRAGGMPYAQVFGDCNPGPPSHWIINRDSLKDFVFHSRHEDNPTLYDEEGAILPQGIVSLRILDSLTGVVKERLRYGKWVGAEGTVYDQFDRRVHVIKKHEVPKCQRRIEVVDFGYVNPFSWQNWHIDHDGRVYVVQQVYHTQRLVEDHCKDIVRVTKRDYVKVEAVICDHDAEDRATFERHRGLKTRGADKLGIRDGIEQVQARLKIQGDGKARFFIVEDSLVELDQSLKLKFYPTDCIEEVDSYVWNEKKDAPEKIFDHGMDSWRYGVRYLDRRGKRRSPASHSSSTG